MYWLLWICPTYQSRPIIFVVYEKALIGALGTLTFSTSKFECCKSLDCISDDTTVMAGATFEDLFVCGNVTRWLVGWNVQGGQKAEEAVEGHAQVTTGDQLALARQANCHTVIYCSSSFGMSRYHS